MYWIYLLECFEDKSWYIGYTADLKTRLKDHLEKHGARTTRRKENWKLIYCEGYVHKKDAQGRERFLKSGAGRRFLKKQLLITSAILKVGCTLTELRSNDQVLDFYSLMR